MRLLDILQGKLVVPQLRARNKWAAIEELVDKLLEEHEIRIFDEREVLDAVLTQERSRSSGLNDRVALPHGRTRVLEDVIGVLGIASAGIPFDSTDGQDAQVICLLVIPEGQYREHVKTLADTARLLETALQTGDSGLAAELQGLRRPAALPSSPSIKFVMLEERTDRYLTYLYVDMRDYARYPQHLERVRGRWVVAADDLAYYLHSGQWRRTFFTLSIAWWAVGGLGLGLVWILRTSERVRAWLLRQE